MNKSLDYIIPQNEYYEQKLYDFRLYKNGIVFCYSNNVLNYINVVAYYCFKIYTLDNVYIQNIPDKVFVDLISTFNDQSCITLKDIKYILYKYHLELNIEESRVQEWEFMGFSKWIMCK
jgi:hypothetical protein